MSRQPIKNLIPANAIRRKVIGVKNVADVFYCDKIDNACREFFRSRGMPVYGQFGNPLPKETKP